MEKQRRFGFPKFLFAFMTNLSLAIGLGNCSISKNENTKKEDYEIASPVYIALAEKSLDYLSNFELNSFASMLAEEVEYELPDGQVFIGKTAVIDYWKKYKITSGITSMTFHNANYLPIDTHIKPKGNELPGVKVLADFTSNIVFKDKTRAVKMNFNIHFDKAKLIDRMSANYDSSKIQTDTLTSM